MSNSQNAMMKAIPTNCIRDRNNFAATLVAMASKPFNRAQAPMAIIINEKYMTPGVFHQRKLINPMMSAMVAVSNEITISDVNCPVNSMSSVY